MGRSEAVDAEVQRLREAFRKYGQHDEACESWSYVAPLTPCSCGFDDAWYAAFPADRPAPQVVTDRAPDMEPR